MFCGRCGVSIGLEHRADFITERQQDLLSSYDMLGLVPRCLTKRWREKGIKREKRKDEEAEFKRRGKGNSILSPKVKSDTRRYKPSRVIS